MSTWRPCLGSAKEPHCTNWAHPSCANEQGCLNATYFRPDLLECSVAVLGSSVARGEGATNDTGWADMLGNALAAPEYNLQLTNLAIGGRTTNLTQLDLQALLAHAVPRIAASSGRTRGYPNTTRPDGGASLPQSSWVLQGGREVAAGRWRGPQRKL